jgi:hypothetical protein
LLVVQNLIQNIHLGRAIGRVAQLLEIHAVGLLRSVDGVASLVRDTCRATEPTAVPATAAVDAVTSPTIPTITGREIVSGWVVSTTTTATTTTVTATTATAATTHED